MAEPIIDDDPGSKIHAYPPGVSYGLVPRDYEVDPLEMFEPPSVMQLIPRSEWSARIKEQIATKSRVSDIRNVGNGGKPIPYLDQNGVGYSHDGQTEVLTEKGWVRWADWNKSDLLGTVNPLTHLLEFQAATEWHANEYRGEMYHSTNRRIDFGVTNYHRMYVRKWDERKRTLSDSYSFVNAEDIGWYSGLLSAPSGFLGTELIEAMPEGCQRKYAGDDLIALLALIVSDGYAGGTDATSNLVSFCCFDERLPAVRALAARVGFREQASRPIFNLYDACLARWVRQNCYIGGIGSACKRVPDIVKWVSSRQIRLFLDFFGDRDVGRDHYYSTSKRLIDDIQELFLRIGRRASIASRGARTALRRDGVEIRSGESWELHAAESSKLCLDRKKHIETDRSSGLVYCATVPNGILVTRRNGSILISGNCWAHSTTHAVMLSRAVANLPYVPLSAFAVAAIIKNGRDEGGWCGQSAKFARDVGIPDQKYWPQGSRQLSRDTSEMRANAALHKITEDWYDLARAIHAQDLTFDQLASCLLRGQPCPVDFNWWGHSVCAMDLVEVEAGSFGIRIWNSWLNWGENGTGIIRGSKAVPDGALCVRQTIPSAA